MDMMLWFNITVVVFTVANLMAGGLECDLKEALKWLRSPKLLLPSLFWGWVVGPALAWLIIFLLLCLGTCLWIYGGDMLDTVGSFAPGAWVIFMVVMAVVPYLIGFGLQQNQRSVMALGQSSRNISAGFVAFFGITNPPAGMFTMVLLVVPLHVIIGLLAVPPIFAKLADKTVEGGAA